MHLVVCVNGFSGHAGEFDNLQRYLRQEHDRRVLSSSGDLHILLSRANEKTRTMHGLVVMGTRLAREVHAYVKDVLAVDVGRGRASSDVEFREEGDAVVGDGEQQVRDEHMTARLGDTAVDERDGTIEQRLTAGDAPTNKLTVHLTIIGHSLGGLIARYAVRLMLAADGGSALPEFDLQMALREGTQGYGVYDTVEVVPLSYISVGSPHL